MNGVPLSDRECRALAEALMAWAILCCRRYRLHPIAYLERLP